MNTQENEYGNPNRQSSHAIIVSPFQSIQRKWATTQKLVE